MKHSPRSKYDCGNEEDKKLRAVEFQPSISGYQHRFCVATLFESWRCDLRISDGSVAEERDDAAKQRNDPEAKNGHTENAIEHLMPNLLVRRYLIGKPCGKRWQEERSQPEETGVSSENRSFGVVGHKRVGGSTSHADVLSAALGGYRHGYDKLILPSRQMLCR